MNRGKLVAIVIGAAIAGGLGVTLGWAAGGDSNQVSACVKDDGQLRVVTTDAGGSLACKKGESTLQWSITGPQGAPGATGATGAQGPQGPPGATVTANTITVIGQASFKGQKQGQIKGGDGTQTLIDFSGWTESVISPRDPASGLPTGKRQHKPITITKEIDAASPLLYGACTTNENLPEVVINLYARGGSTTKTTVKLTDASCASLEHNGAYETIALTFRKIEWTWVDGGITAVDDWETPNA